jgi:hypothetical protein
MRIGGEVRGTISRQQEQLEDLRQKMGRNMAGEADFVCRLCNSVARAANRWIAEAGACKALKAEVTAAVIRVPDRVRSAHPTASHVSHTQDRNRHGATRAAFVPVCILFVQASMLPPQLARGDIHSAALRAASQLCAQLHQTGLSECIPLRGGEAVPSNGL